MEVAGAPGIGRWTLHLTIRCLIEECARLVLVDSARPGTGASE